MNINIKATNMELTGAIREYTTEKVSSIEKFMPQADTVNVFIEIGKESNHHQKGDDVYKAEIRMSIRGKEFFAENRNADLHAAIDAVRDEAVREIKNEKEKNQTLFIRGARSLKKRIKGMKPWWPFGGKSEGETME